MKRWFFYLAIILIPALAAVASAQRSRNTFTSSDGLFRFKYSNMLVDCDATANPSQGDKSGMSKMSGDHRAGSPNPDACSGVCIGPGSEGNVMACFAYPKERYKDKPHFVAATFFVAEIQSAKTEKECLEASPNWFVISPKAGTTTINHVTFRTFEIGDNWTGHGESGPAYRTFHSGRCYELGIQTVISRAEYDPGTVKEFTKKDQSEVEGRLRQALNSFVFLR
jgi:hypothetical protein